MKKPASAFPLDAALSDVGEFGFLNFLRLSQKALRDPVVVGLGDDAAVLRPPSGWDLVFTTDLLIEGRHFEWNYFSAFEVGAKAAAVNISDAAAMGAKPLAFVVSLALPADTKMKTLLQFYSGLQGWADAYGAKLVGGDMSLSERWVVNVALLGQVEKGKALTRSKAKVGDALVVTGTLGDAAAGLCALREPGKASSDVEEILKRRQTAPTPRFTVGRWLASRGAAHACLDLSDGLAGDVHRLAEASGVGVEIHEEALPVSAALSAYAKATGRSSLELALRGGEDYELLFTVPLEKLSWVLRELPAQTGVECRPIGRVVAASKGVSLILRDGKRRKLLAEGFDHFRRRI